LRNSPDMKKLLICGQTQKIDHEKKNVGIDEAASDLLVCAREKYFPWREGFGLGG